MLYVLNPGDMLDVQTFVTAQAAEDAAAAVGVGPRAPASYGKPVTGTLYRVQAIRKGGRAGYARKALQWFRWARGVGWYEVTDPSFDTPIKVLRAGREALGVP